MIGRTPLLRLDVRLDGRPLSIYAKYEQENMTGSVKDRMALHIVRHAYQTGELRPGCTIVEATSGNTGLSFAAIGRAIGHPVRIFMPDWMSRERVLIIQAFGAEIIPVSREQGGFVGSIAMAEEYAKQRDDVFLPRQFCNQANVCAHEQTTGPEIVAQLGSLGLVADVFVAGVGTGGTVMGVGRCLRRVNPGVCVHPLEPANSPTLRTGHRVGHHRIQGISDEFIPSIVNLSELDEVVDVWDGDAILMSQALARRGLAVGISSGANVVGAIELAKRAGPGSVVVTVLPDSNKKYLSTDLFREEPIEPHYVAPRVEIVGWCSIACAAVS
ncbi:MAG: cysteine synthase family protein [Leptolyngbya sp. PLA3]|nr:MAG: cysteine synthase family protein [Cyanobacteria bacterium CYA]MCE7969602.1 cysteine synthase family protein [Leptolyngbya sp. PL-A3]